MTEFFWRRDDSYNFHGRFVLPSGARIDAVVESLPSGGWDWLVWQAGQPAAAQYGLAITADVALAAATAALTALAPE